MSKEKEWDLGWIRNTTEAEAKSEDQSSKGIFGRVLGVMGIGKKTDEDRDPRNRTSR